MCKWSSCFSNWQLFCCDLIDFTSLFLSLSQKELFLDHCWCSGIIVRYWLPATCQIHKAVFVVVVVVFHRSNKLLKMEMEAFYRQYRAVAYTRKGFWQGNGFKERPVYCYYVISKSCKLCVWKNKSSHKRGCKYEQMLGTFKCTSIAVRLFLIKCTQNLYLLKLVQVCSEQWSPVWALYEHNDSV